MLSEKLPPLDEKYLELTSDLGAEEGDSDVAVRLRLDCRERQLLSLISEVEQLRNQNGGWISVETRKPDYGEEVLVYYGDGYMRLNTLFDDEPDFIYWKPIQPPLIEHPAHPSSPNGKTE